MDGRTSEPPERCQEKGPQHGPIVRPQFGHTTALAVRHLDVGTVKEHGARSRPHRKASELLAIAGPQFDHSAGIVLSHPNIGSIENQVASHDVTEAQNRLPITCPEFGQTESSKIPKCILPAANLLVQAATGHPDIGPVKDQVVSAVSHAEGPKHGPIIRAQLDHLIPVAWRYPNVGP